MVGIPIFALARGGGISIKMLPKYVRRSRGSQIVHSVMLLYNTSWTICAWYGVIDTLTFRGFEEWSNCELPSTHVVLLNWRVWLNIKLFADIDERRIPLQSRVDSVTVTYNDTEDHYDVEITPHNCANNFEMIRLYLAPRAAGSTCKFLGSGCYYKHLP